MPITQSDTLETQSAKPYSGIVERVSNTTKLLQVEDNNILNDDIATARGKYEILINGAIQTRLVITTYYQDIKINDTITVIAPEYKIPEQFNRELFKVKSVSHSFVGSKAETTISCERYDFE